MNNRINELIKFLRSIYANKTNVGHPGPVTEIKDQFNIMKKCQTNRNATAISKRKTMAK